MLIPADATPYRALRLRALREHPDAFTSSYEEERERPVDAAASASRRTRSAGGPFAKNPMHLDLSSKP